MEIVKSKKILETYQKRYGIDSILSNVDQYPLELRYYNKGEHICINGDPFHYFYFLLEGKVKVYNTLANGKSLLYTFFMGFEMIGDIELSIQSEFRTNIQAISNVVCMAIPVSGYEKQMREDRVFLGYLSKQLGLKLDYCSRASSYNLLYPLENRLASYIMITAEDDIFPENLTHVSELLATSYRHLLRTLRIFCEKEYIEKKNDSYLIKDKNALLTLGTDIYLR